MLEETIDVGKYKYENQKFENSNNLDYLKKNSNSMNSNKMQQILNKKSFKIFIIMYHFHTDCFIILFEYFIK